MEPLITLPVNRELLSRKPALPNARKRTHTEMLLEDIPTKPSLSPMRLCRSTLLYQRKLQRGIPQPDQEDRWESFFLSLPAAQAGGGSLGVREYWAERPLCLADFTNQRDKEEHFRCYALAEGRDGYRQGERIWLYLPTERRQRLLRLVDDDKQPKRTQAFISDMFLR